MRAVDTNVLVRLIMDDEPAQTSAARQFIRPGAWVSLLALTECTWVLESYYDRSPHQIASGLAVLLAHESLTIQDADTAMAALELFRSHPKLGYADCLMLRVAIKAGHQPFGTFDKGLARLAGAQRL